MSRRTGQVDWHEGGVPVVGDEHTVLAIQAAVQLHLQRHLQRGQRQQRIPELQTETRFSRALHAAAFLEGGRRRCDERTHSRIRTSEALHFPS